MNAHAQSSTAADVALEAAALLRLIGRGPGSSRGLSRERARWLMARILAGELAEVQLGAVLLALRMKGETAEELLGCLDAVEAGLPRLDAGRPLVVLASVNGARRLVNQVPLLCMRLRSRGVASLVIGHEHVDDRLHTRALWSALGLPNPGTLRDAESVLRRGDPVYLPLDRISPSLATLMSRRRMLGVRNVAHSLVKLIAPVAAPTLLLSGYTHGEYGALMQQVLQDRGRAAMVLHGCEGEAVPHPTRRTSLLWAGLPAGLDPPSELAQGAASQRELAPPGCELDAGRDWTLDVMQGRCAAPAALEHFVDTVSEVLSGLDRGSAGERG